MKTLFAQRPQFKPWETVLAVVLVAGYFTLMGEAIHCQYFLQDHEEHHHTSSRAVSHTTHCLMANYGTMVATLSAESARFNPLQFLTSVLCPGPVSTGSGDVIANTTRAPPSVSSVV